MVFTEYDFIGRLGAPEDQLWYDNIQEALKRLGHDFDVRFEPGKQAIHHALSGQSDGLLFQSPMLKELFPSLVRVEFQLAVVPIYLYGMKERELDSICEQRIGMLMGFDEFSVRLQELFQCPKPVTPHYGHYMKKMLMMLKSEQLDWFLAPVVMEPFLNAHVDKQFYRLGASEIKLPVYMYLSEQNQALAEPLSEALAEVYREKGVDNTSYRPVRLGESLQR
ncbi:hypothetical protein R50073_43050 [Maricurvus nonylphenolicus]